MAATATVPAERGAKSMSDEQALEKPSAKTPAVITTPDEYRGALLRWQEQRFNVLTPFANMSSIAPHHGMISTLVTLSTNPDDKDTYDNAGGRLKWLKNDELAPAKNGLRKIEEALGISHRLDYISVATIRHYWHVKAIGSYRGLDGSIQTREASQEWDLRDDSVRLKGWTPSQIEEARKSGLRNCEERAINAMIRACGCGVKQAYKKADLAKPFVAVRVMFSPDMSDPAIKALVTTHALGGMTTLYPSQSRDLPPVDREDEAPTSTAPRHVGSGSTAAAKPVEPDPDAPPCEGAVRIATIEPPKTGNKNGRTWTKWTVVDSNGVEYSTFSRTLYEACEKAKTERAWVELLDEQTEDGKYRNLVEIAPAGQSPRLPNLDDV